MNNEIIRDKRGNNNFEILFNDGNSNSVFVCKIVPPDIFGNTCIHEHTSWNFV